MSQRRPIACTICAKAKTKCDKLTPSCSRCTAKGLQCEPRSTRRTSDSNYRNAKKHLVSPKRYSSANSVSTIGRHTSPRSVPSSDHRQIVRSVSQLGFHPGTKMSHQPAGISGYPMLTPLQTYQPQIIDECYSYSSSPERNMTAFSQPMEKNGYLSSGRLTPQTPEPYSYNEPLSIVDSFEQIPNTQPWNNDNQLVPMGLGIQNDMSGMLSAEGWPTPEPETTTPMGMCDSPSSMNLWSTPALSVSPPQMHGFPSGMPPHSAAVPSLSVSSEGSTQDFDSPNSGQNEWSGFGTETHPMAMPQPTTSGAFIGNVRARSQPMWEDVTFPRTSTF